MPAASAMVEDMIEAEPPYDARAVANLLLTYGHEQGVPLSNLSLQKVLYFAHGLYLTRHGKPLIQGYFEAWEHGPVHPLVYQSFKKFGAGVIQDLADRLDLKARKKVAIEAPSREDIRFFLRGVSRTYGRMSPGQLVNWSHRKNAPWRAVVGDGSDERSRYGLRIDNAVILDRFRFHKFALAETSLDGDSREELPPCAD